MIEIKVRKKISGGRGTAHFNFDCSFQTNAITRISGPSGSGKTTLLKLIAGIARPDDGLIKMDNEIWFSSQEKYSREIQERHLGFVFQDYALFQHMTTLEQLLYGNNDKGFAEYLLSLGEMNSFSKHLPRQLSGGQQQRLALLRALSTRPKLLLMDEPFSALDEALKSKITPRLIKLLAEMQTTTLIVTHNLLEFDIPGMSTYIINNGNETDGQ